MCKLFGKVKIPYPEEAPDYSRTIDNVSIEAVVTKWLVSYFVPMEHWGLWRTRIEIILDPNVQALVNGVMTDVPAIVWGENNVRKMKVRPAWLNPGVIAHEQAHNSYSLLTPADKQFFAVAHAALKDADPLIKLLYKTKRPTWGDFDVEGHAEIYRFLGYKMPETLKQYYPKLF